MIGIAVSALLFALMIVGVSYLKGRMDGRHSMMTAEQRQQEDEELRRDMMIW